MTLQEQYGPITIASDFYACAALIAHGDEQPSYGGILCRWFSVLRLIEEEERELKAESALAGDPSLNAPAIEYLQAQGLDIRLNWMTDAALIRITRMLPAFEHAVFDDRQERKESLDKWRRDCPDLAAAYFAR